MTARFVAALAVAALLVGACSEDDDRIGTEAQFCAGAEQVTTSLQTLAQSPDLRVADLRAIRADLRSLPAPEALRTDLDLMAEVVDEVLDGLEERDLTDPAELVDVQDRLSGLEARAESLQAASDRLFFAIDACRVAADS